MSFGQNAFGPQAAFVCGQSYETMTDVCDFLEPLLGYMEWHVLQPLAVWADLFAVAAGLDSIDAIQLSAELFSLEGIELPVSSHLAVTAGEGSPAVIEKTVGRQMEMIAKRGLSDVEYLPVLRGTGWSVETVGLLEAEAERIGFKSLFYQGTRVLAGEPPCDGWS